MHYTKFIAASAITWGTIHATAMSHGESGSFNGLTIRYQQLAPDVFTGVPVDEWDDEVNQISDEGWDIGAITSDSQKLDLRDLELESRNLFGFCQARLDCVKKGGAKLVDGWVNFVTILQYSWENKAHLGNTLVGYFNQPFLANAGGVAIAGVISSNINERLQKKVATECSTSGSEADTISAAVAGALAANPSATQVSVTLNGPSGSWTITVVAAPAGETPKAEC